MLITSPSPTHPLPPFQQSKSLAGGSVNAQRSHLSHLDWLTSAPAPQSSTGAHTATTAASGNLHLPLVVTFPKLFQSSDYPVIGSTTPPSLQLREQSSVSPEAQASPSASSATQLKPIDPATLSGKTDEQNGVSASQSEIDELPPPYPEAHKSVSLPQSPDPNQYDFSQYNAVEGHLKDLGLVSAPPESWQQSRPHTQQSQRSGLRTPLERTPRPQSSQTERLSRNDQSEAGDTEPQQDQSLAPFPGPAPGYFSFQNELHYTLKVNGTGQIVRLPLHFNGEEEDLFAHLPPEQTKCKNFCADRSDDLPLEAVGAIPVSHFKLRGIPDRKTGSPTGSKSGFSLAGIKEEHESADISEHLTPSGEPISVPGSKLAPAHARQVEKGLLVAGGWNPRFKTIAEHDFDIMNPQPLPPEVSAHVDPTLYEYSKMFRFNSTSPLGGKRQCYFTKFADEQRKKH